MTLWISTTDQAHERFGNSRASRDSLNNIRGLQSQTARAYALRWHHNVTVEPSNNHNSQRDPRQPDVGALVQAVSSAVARRSLAGVFEAIAPTIENAVTRQFAQLGHPMGLGYALEAFLGAIATHPTTAGMTTACDLARLIRETPSTFPPEILMATAPLGLSKLAEGIGRSGQAGHLCGALQQLRADNHLLYSDHQLHGDLLSGALSSPAERLLENLDGVLRPPGISARDLGATNRHRILQTVADRVHHGEALKAYQLLISAGFGAEELAASRFGGEIVRAIPEALSHETPGSVLTVASQILPWKERERIALAGEPWKTQTLPPTFAEGLSKLGVTSAIQANLERQSHYQEVARDLLKTGAIDQSRNLVTLGILPAAGWHATIQRLLQEEPLRPHSGLGAAILNNPDLIPGPPSLTDALAGCEVGCDAVLTQIIRSPRPENATDLLAALAPSRTVLTRVANAYAQDLVQHGRSGPTRGDHIFQAAHELHDLLGFLPPTFQSEAVKDLARAAYLQSTLKIYTGADAGGQPPPDLDPLLLPGEQPETALKRAMVRALELFGEQTFANPDVAAQARAHPPFAAAISSPEVRAAGLAWFTRALARHAVVTLQNHATALRLDPAATRAIIVEHTQATLARSPTAYSSESIEKKLRAFAPDFRFDLATPAMRACVQSTLEALLDNADLKGTANLLHRTSDASSLTAEPNAHEQAIRAAVKYLSQEQQPNGDWDQAVYSLGQSFRLSEADWQQIRIAAVTAQIGGRVGRHRVEMTKALLGPMAGQAALDPAAEPAHSQLISSAAKAAVRVLGAGDTPTLATIRRLFGIKASDLFPSEVQGGGSPLLAMMDPAAKNLLPFVSIEELATWVRTEAPEQCGTLAELFLAHFVGNRRTFQSWYERSPGGSAGISRALKEMGITELPSCLTGEVPPDTAAALAPWRDLVREFKLTSLTQLESFIQANRGFVGDVLESRSLKVTAAHEPVRAALNLTLAELQTLEAHIDTRALHAAGKHGEIVEALHAHVAGWTDATNVVTPMRAFADRFGWRETFAFLHGRGPESLHNIFSRAHHALNLSRILQERHGLSPAQFAARFLRQVALDGAPYGNQSAYTHFYDIAEQFRPDIAQTLAAAREYPGLTELQELVAAIGSPQETLASWRSLRRYHDIGYFLAKRELLQDLESIRESDPLLYRYISTLAFHRDSKVDIQAVMQFWKDPAGFLDRNEIHRPELHNRKKPIHYTRVWHLRPSPENLRDALVRGTLDRLQAFPPMRVELTLPLLDSCSAFKLAVGSQGMGNGRARQPKKLYQAVRNELTNHGVSIDDFLAAIPLPPAAEQPIHALLYSPTLGMPLETRELIVELHRKSDPLAVLSGNDADNCMAYGSGKSGVYAFNPSVCYLTVRLKNQDGRLRTVAQSVLSKDGLGTKSVPDLLAAAEKALREQKTVDLTKLLDPRDVHYPMSFLAIDNVEVAKNYRDVETISLIERAYQSFFTSYIERFATELNLNPKLIPIGMEGNENSAFRDAPRIRNRFFPHSPMAYSDKVGPQVMVLRPNRKPLAVGETVTVTPIPGRERYHGASAAGVRPIHVDDIPALARLEQLVYGADSEFCLAPDNLQNHVIGEAIAREHTGLPPLALQYRDARGTMMGYLLAYQGAFTPADVDSRIRNLGIRKAGDPMVFISHIVRDPASHVAAARLMLDFGRRYGEAYGSTPDTAPPVYAELRGKTSYGLLSHLQRAAAEHHGIAFHVQEFPGFELDGEPVIPVLLTPRWKLAA